MKLEGRKVNRFVYSCLIIIAGLLAYQTSFAAPGDITAFTVHKLPDGGASYDLSFKMLATITLLTLLPALLLTSTAFTRIIIVLAILRQAIGMPNTPTNQIIVGISLFLTLFIMGPVIQQVNTQAVQPYLNHQLNEKNALMTALKPFKKFMLAQTRTDDLELFLKLAKKPRPDDLKQTPFTVLMPTFLTSELKTAFQIGFLIYIPFLIIDLVVASVLMSMGMMMLSPLVISLPFKIMLFVMVNGWVLLLGTLSSSFSLG